MNGRKERNLSYLKGTDAKKVRKVIYNDDREEGHN